MQTTATPSPARPQNHAISSGIVADGLRVRLLPRTPYRVAFTPSNLVIGFAFDSQSGDHAFASDRVVPFITRPATAAVTPAGCDVFSRSAHGGEYLAVEVPDPQSLGLAVDRVRARTNLVVPKIRDTASRLRAGLLAARPDAFGIAESALTLADAVLAATHDHSPRQAAGAGSLTDRRLRLLTALIESRLGDRLTLADMAATVGLTPRFFLRAFRAATGTSPHAYLLERRLEAARRQLRESDATIASIAVATGFASQAHLGTTFRRTFGTTPSAFRQTLR